MAAWEGVSFSSLFFQAEARKHLLEMMTRGFLLTFQLRFFFLFIQVIQYYILCFQQL